MRASKELLILLSLALPGCLFDNNLYSYPDYSQEEHRVGSVKLIGRGIERGDDPSTFGQKEFRIGAERRLLLRYEKLTKVAEKIVVSEDEPLEVRVTLADPQDWPEDSPHPPLELCPLGQSWMMLATWRTAHPYSTRGEWETEGGDALEEECVGISRREGERVYFNLTQWFHLHIQDQERNEGWLLRSTAEIGVKGKIQVLWYSEL